MSSAARNKTNRQTVGVARAAAEVSLQIGKEFRIFQHMSFVGRVWWFVTGRISISRRARRLLVENLKESAV